MVKESNSPDKVLGHVNHSLVHSNTYYPTVCERYNQESDKGEPIPRKTPHSKSESAKWPEKRAACGKRPNVSGRCNKWEKTSNRMGLKVTP